jgi:formate--tetrahydrofolate ligase
MAATDTHTASLAIAQAAQLRDIEDVASDLGLTRDVIEPHGRFKAKVPPDAAAHQDRAPGKLVCVTAITPTPSGEGKTTTAISLTDGLWQLGQRAALCLREPSLGPVFGAKGGAAGGGRAQIVPMEEINLHFTGDIHAIGAANNLLAAMLDSHLHGNGNDRPRRSIGALPRHGRPCAPRSPQASAAQTASRAAPASTSRPLPR